MSLFEFRKIAFKAVMYSKSLDKFFVSEPMEIDSGLSCLFGFENKGLGELEDKVLCSKKFIDEIKEEWWERDWVHIGNLQYSGKEDKHGIGIYEGDVLAGINGSINGVGWEWGNWEIKFEDCGFNVPLWGTRENHNKTHWVEIIGNIYENRELKRVNQ